MYFSRHICDGEWQCPFGEDESIVSCQTYYCVGLFHCVMAHLTICIHPSSVCDGTFDCPSNEDELLCDLPRKCPVGYVCLLYAVQCTSKYVSMESVSNILEHVVFCKLSDVILAQSVIKSKISFVFINSSLEDICFPLLCKGSNVQHLDFGCNKIKLLWERCLCFAPNLSVLMLSRNKIEQIYTHVFHWFPQMIFLNVSRNLISSIDPFLTGELQNLSIDVSFNNIERLNSDLADFASLKAIITHTFTLCCFFEDSCFTKPVWPDNCCRLLETNFAEKVVFCESSAVVIFGFTSMLILCAKLRNHKSKKFNVKNKQQGPESVAYLSSMATFSVHDIVFGMYLSVLSSESLYFNQFYALSARNWQSSFCCKGLGIAFLFLCLSSLFLSNIVSLSKFIAVMFPFNNSLKRTHNMLRIVSLVFVLIFSLCIFCFVSFFWFEEKRVMPNKICSFAGDTKDSTTILCVTLFVLVLQICAFILITVEYFVMFEEIMKKKFKKFCSAQMSHNRRAILIKFVVYTLCNGLCWIPSAVIYALTVSLAQYPIQLLTWNTVLINPLNSLFNPIIFTLASSLKQQYCFKCCQPDHNN